MPTTQPQIDTDVMAAPLQRMAHELPGGIARTLYLIFASPLGIVVLLMFAAVLIGKAVAARRR